MKYGVYIDFDNIIGGFKASLGIEDNNIHSFQKILFPVVLKKFLQNIRIVKLENGNILFKKAFAEFHNLPIKKDLLRTEPQIFLNNIGIKPINPFVVRSGSKGKKKNAADISLTLEVINDLILKKNPLDAVVLCSGDIDFYPLISWIKEHTGKSIYLISFADDINGIYFDIFAHLENLENILYAEYFLFEALKEVTDLNFLKQNIKEEDLLDICKNFEYLANTILNIIDRLKIDRLKEKKSLPLYEVQLYYLFKTDLENDTYLHILDNLRFLENYCKNVDK